MTSAFQQQRIAQLTGKTVQVHEYGRPTTRGVVEETETHTDGVALWINIRQANGEVVRHYDRQPGSKVEVVEDESDV